MVYTAGAFGGIWAVSYKGTATLLYDDGHCAASDSDTKLCVYKSADSHTTTFKNRLGSTQTLRITIYSF